MTDQTRPMDAEELELIRERHETGLDASPSSCDYCVDENGNLVPLGTCDAFHLLAEVTRLTAERDAAREQVRAVWARLMERAAEHRRLRAVIEEARSYEMQFTEMKMPEIRALDAILDRGLNGAGE